MMPEVDSYQHTAAQAGAVTTATYGEARSFDTEAEMVQSITGAAPAAKTAAQASIGHCYQISTIADLTGAMQALIPAAAGKVCDWTFVPPTDTGAGAIGFVTKDAASTSGGGNLTLDQLADDTLIRVAAFIGECVGGDTFAGFSVDETRDEHGLLLSLSLVPCDTVAGEPVRRVGRQT